MKFLKNPMRDEDGISCSKIHQKTALEVAKFYSKAPFPNYQGYENKFVLAEIVSKNAFLNDLKNYIGFNKSFIEVGSGTSQLSLAMAIGTNNLVVALDPTKESLRLGRDFAKKNSISNVIFLNSDIFNNDIQDASFDVVWCSGVLHHTKNSKQGFEIISCWVKKDGLIIVGVYNKIGRLRTNFRQLIYKGLGKSDFAKRIISGLDPHLRKNLSDEKKLAWFRDQYEHPVERKHSLDEVMSWFEKNGISYLGSVPSPSFKFETVSQMNGYNGSYFERICAQFFMLFSNLGGEGGLCIVIGKKQ